MATIYAGGDNGTVIKSEDFGVNWVLKSSPSSNDIFSVFSFEGDTVWVAGRGGMVYKSVDGGDNWTSASLPSIGSSIVRRIVFFDSDNGALFATFGADGKFYVTTNGGSSWTKRSEEFQNNDTYFRDQNNWISCTNQGQIRKTVNGGLSWATIVSNIGGGSPQKIHFAKGLNQGYVVHTNGGFKRSEDFGNSWSSLKQIPGQVGTPESSQMKYVFTEHRGERFAFMGSGKNLGLHRGSSVINLAASNTNMNATAQNTLNGIFNLTNSRVFWVGDNGEIITTDNAQNYAAMSFVRRNGITSQNLRSVHGSEVAQTCSIQIDSISTDDTVGQGNGQITINAIGATNIEYRVESQGFDSGWVSSNIFQNLNSGSYTVFVRDSDLAGCEATGSATIQLIQELNATISSQDSTAFEANDGQAEVTVLSGSGNYSFSWNSGQNTSLITGLSPAIYICTVTDNVTGLQVQLNAIINEPDPIPPEPDPFLEVPKMQSLHFAVEDNPDNCAVFQGFDNVLFCKQKHPFYEGLQYYQKFNQCDAFRVQFRSSYSNIVAELRDYTTDAVVTTYDAPTKIVEGLNQVDRFDIRLQDNGSNQTRVYFVGSSTIPIVLEIGDIFEIVNSNGFDGSYSIVNILTDTITEEQYLVINADYTSANNSENADAVFLNDNLPFDIYEFVVDFSAELPGNYYVRITTQNLDESITLVATSEPIALKTDHENTSVIRWTNVDNAYDIDYSTNITHLIRIDTVAFERIPASENTVNRNTTGRYNLLTAKPQRKIRARFYDLPPYMHEKIAIAFLNDTIFFNNVRVISQEGLEEPTYRLRFGLANSIIVMEQLEWFSTINSTDTGGIETPSNAGIIANQTLVKR